jgi:hypothetical protein
MSATGFKQIRASGGYYINVADTRATFYQNNGTDVAPLLSANMFARSTMGGVSTILATAGSAVFRDHGKNLVSSGRTFRKVQLVVPRNSASTFGVAGPALDANSLQGYLTGYIETGFDASSSATPTPVAKWGR